MGRVTAKLGRNLRLELPEIIKLLLAVLQLHSETGASSSAVRPALSLLLVQSLLLTLLC